MRRYWAIIPATGVGLRFGADQPKQYARLNQATLLEHAVNPLTALPWIEKVVVVLHPDDHYWSHLKFDDPSKIITAVGGEKRVDSVLQGLELINRWAEFSDWVMVHDAVRPAVRQLDYERIKDALINDEVGGLFATPVNDTLKKVDSSGNVIETVSRDKIWAAQTPQLFRFGLLFKAIKTALKDGVTITDESNAVEHIGEKPKVVLGSPYNIKVTQQADLEWIKRLLE